MKFSTSIIIRHARPEDAPIIAQFQINMARETESKELDTLTIRTGVEAVFNDQSHGFYLVAEFDDQVVGSLLVTYEWSDWRNGNIWYIQSVYVAGDFRGRGIFKRMYQQIVQHAQAAGATKIRLYVEQDNLRAQHVYQTNGMNQLPYFMYEADI